jgi:hypothetical protein
MLTIAQFFVIAMVFSVLTKIFAAGLSNMQLKRDGCPNDSTSDTQFHLKDRTQA